MLPIPPILFMLFMLFMPDIIPELPSDDRDDIPEPPVAGVDDIAEVIPPIPPKEVCRCGAPGGGARLNPDPGVPPRDDAFGAGGGASENDDALDVWLLVVDCICPRDMPPNAEVGGFCC